MSDLEQHPTADLERTLARGRPTPSPELRRRVDGRIREERRAVRLYAGSRVSFAAALTVFMLGSFASVGGLGYAANGAQSALRAAKESLVPSKRDTLRRVNGSSGQLQYGGDNIALCHRVAPGEFVIITVPIQEREEHLAHGDRLPEAGQCPTIRVETKRSPRGDGRAPLGGAPRERAPRLQRLPFTGAGLAGTAVVALGLLGVGLALRRRAASRVRD